jgi:hypothetical protein
MSERGLPGREERARSPQRKRGEGRCAHRRIVAHTRLHVEEAEDKLVQATETAIGLMKAVLENVS